MKIEPRISALIYERHELWAKSRVFKPKFVESEKVVMKGPDEPDKGKFIDLFI